MLPKRAYLITATAFFLIGAIILLNSFESLTGFVIFENAEVDYGYFVGLWFIIVGILILSTAPLHHITSKIKEDKGLVRLAKEATRDASVQRDINHLTHELAKGNTNPGLGSSNLFQNVSYLRGRNGGRVFYRTAEKGYEILGKSSKYNEQQVINRLRQLYEKQKRRVA